MSLKQKEIHVPKTCHLLFLFKSAPDCPAGFLYEVIGLFCNKCQNTFMPGALSVWIFTSLFRADVCQRYEMCVFTYIVLKRDNFAILRAKKQDRARNVLSSPPE